MFHALRLPAVLAMTLLLSACLVTPGKFVSTLDIRADRTFTFTYKGEVLVFDMGSEMSKDMQNMGSGESDEGESFDGEPSDSSLFRMIAMQNNKGGRAAPSPRQNSGDDFSDMTEAGNSSEADGGMFAAETSKAKMEAIAEALSKERGYRSVKYVGGNKFEIDYAITGTLDHGFVYPFNIDAEIVFPFIALELRGPDKVRVKAPGFANSEGKSGPGGMGAGMGDGKKTHEAMDGTFTLTTAAEIVSQNQEDGATILPDGRKQIVWKVTALTKDAPTAVLKLKALP